MITNKTLVRFSDLSVKRETTQVFQGLSFEVREGEFVALLGTNGSGKSTLLDLISGALSPTAGAVKVTAPAFAFVPQRTAVNEHVPLTVRDAIAMGRWRNAGMFSPLTRRDKSLIDAQIERMQLREIASSQLRSLSGGQRQRTLLAQALVQQAPLLLLDEPEAALDAHARNIIIETIQEESQRGTTVLMATHEAASARHADRCILLGERAGGIIADGPPGRVLSHETLARAFHAH